MVPPVPPILTGEAADRVDTRPGARIAERYHGRTKHTYRSVRTEARPLDWQNRPLPFKIYETLQPIPLPRELSLQMPALDAIGADGSGSPGRRVLDLAALARILYLSNGITKVMRGGGETYAFRAASCTGALYHIELYLVCGDLPDLPAGVYHYGAHDHALRRVRGGDFREVVLRATANEPQVARAPAIVVSTDTFWRNAWKYGARAYRHSGWDNGVILANLLATTAAVGLSAEVVCGFADDEVNGLLSLDTEREVAVSMVALGRDERPIPAAPPGRPLDLPTTPLSRSEVDYPLIRKIHAASSLPVTEVAAWRGSPPHPQEPSPAGLVVAPVLPDEEGISRDPLDVVLQRRGSSRRFAHQPITVEELSMMLSRCNRGVPADFLGPFGTSLNEVYLIVNAVDDLPSGGYVYHRDPPGLERLRSGDARQQAAYLALEQRLAGEAAVNIYYLAALDPILARFGDRGYRAVQLEAGILGGKVYLAAYALGLGATGLTFYDDDLIEFFSPHASGKSTIFLMAVGHPRRRTGLRQAPRAAARAGRTDR